VKGGRFVGLGLGAVAVWLALRGVSGAELGEALAAMDLWALVPLTLLGLGQQLVRGARQLVLVRPLSPRATFRGELAIAWIGVFAVHTFPARLGEAVRPVLWKQRDGISLAGAAGVIVAEKALDLVGLVVSLLVVAIAGRLPAAGVEIGGVQLDLVATGRGLAMTVLPVTLVGLVVAAVAGPRAMAPVTALAARVRGRRLRALVETVARGLAGFAEGFRALRRPVVVGVVVVATVAYFVAMAATVVVLARAFGLGAFIGLVAALGVLCVTLLGLALPAPPGFAGVFEASLRAGLAVFGVAGGALDGRALALAIVLHAWMYLVQGGGAAYFLWRDGLSLAGSRTRARGR